MKTDRLSRLIQEMRRNENSASHVAVSALVVVTVLYASTIM
jgi:hypothetical protein